MLVLEKLKRDLFDVFYYPNDEYARDVNRRDMLKYLLQLVQTVADFHKREIGIFDLGLENAGLNSRGDVNIFGGFLY